MGREGECRPNQLPSSAHRRDTNVGVRVGNFSSTSALPLRHVRTLAMRCGSRMDSLRSSRVTLMPGTRRPSHHLHHGAHSPRTTLRSANGECRPHAGMQWVIGCDPRVPLFDRQHRASMCS